MNTREPGQRFLLLFLEKEEYSHMNGTTRKEYFSVLGW
jgi:hypothetical protein